jgi:DNA-binding transcriptional LysR family regulator
MKALENELDCKLIDKIGKKIVLTYEGEQLLEVAKQVLNQMDGIRERLVDASELRTTRLRIATSPAMCKYFMPEILREFLICFPDCKFDIHNCDTPQAFDLLRNQKVDLAITLRPEKEVDLDYIDLFSDELMLVYPSSHNWATKPNLILDDICNENLFLYRKTSYTYRIIMDHFKKSGSTPQLVTEMDDVDSIKELIKVGIGVGILPYWAIKNDVQAKVLSMRAFSSSKLRRHWVVSYLKGKNINIAEQTLVQLSKDAVTSVLS